MPPQPLKRATVSGIEVIGTRWAVMAPSTPPTNVPAMIQVQAALLMPARAEVVDQKTQHSKAHGHSGQLIGACGRNAPWRDL